MKKLILILFLLISLSILSKNIVFASSPYVLPYPSDMPGSKLYIVGEIRDALIKYIYFGDFGQFKYNLAQSDKHLVEAKILFEYGQLLLAAESLEKSNDFYLKIDDNLENAKKNNKDISEKKIIYDNASLKHIEVLEGLKTVTPESFNWSPENDSSSELYIHELLNSSMQLRRS